MKNNLRVNFFSIFLIQNINDGNCFSYVLLILFIVTKNSKKLYFYSIWLC